MATMETKSSGMISSNVQRNNCQLRNILPED